MSKSWERTQSVKIVLIMLGITLWCLSILMRLAFLQIVRHEEYAQKARIKQQITRPVSAPRGNIYDGSMVVLATSVPVSTVVAVPKKIENKRETARNLAAILNIDPETLFSRMSDPKSKSYLVVKRRIDPADEARIEALGVKGVYFEDESMRVYPHRDCASHALGFVNMNNDGGAGVELQYDKDLKGEDGMFSFDVDARQQSFRVNVEKPPVQGNSLVLSIDNMIQYIADRELEAAVKNADAKAGTAIVMESDTGRILALSNYPRFNCNNYNEVDSKHWKNMAVTDMFEPGSTFKVVVAAAALDAGLTRPEEMIDCQMGSITLGRHPFRDHKAYGLLTFKEILEHSSNVGAIKLGLRLGQQRLYEALRTFGFGSETGVDLPGEIVGLVRDWKNWSGLSIGAISFGQEVGVTSMQILTAINSIANGGYRVRPSVVDRIIDESRNIIRENQPERIQIMSPRTAEAVTEAFEGVVLRGTGRHAALEGYRAAGKTGTAQKSVNGQYQKGSYLSSFIGFAPLPNPRVTILVQIDEPRDGYYGGDVCAPYFKNIAQEVLLQLRVPPDTNLTPPKFNSAIANAVSEDFLPDSVPVQPLAESDTDSSSEDQQEIIDIPIDGKWIVLPDFRGQSKRSVLNQCVDLGIHLQSEGSGTAIFQSPLPGTKIPVGSTCGVTFTKTDLKENVATLEPHPAVRNVNPRLSSNNSP